jgi:hypothetical protein
MLPSASIYHNYLAVIYSKEDHHRKVMTWCRQRFVLVMGDEGRSEQCSYPFSKKNLVENLAKSRPVLVCSSSCLVAQMYRSF